MLSRCGRRLVGQKVDGEQQAPAQASGYTSSFAQGGAHSHRNDSIRSESSRDTHRVTVPTDVRPSDWFRASLPGYSPPRWIELQLPERFAAGSELEVTVPRLRESVYSTQAKRAPFKRVLCTFVPTVHLFFIWALVRRPAHVNGSDRERLPMCLATAEHTGAMQFPLARGGTPYRVVPPHGARPPRHPGPLLAPRRSRPTTPS